jgi:hypothetical protein
VCDAPGEGGAGGGGRRGVNACMICGQPQASSLAWDHSQPAAPLTKTGRIDQRQVDQDQRPPHSWRQVASRHPAAHMYCGSYLNHAIPCGWVVGREGKGSGGQGGLVGRLHCWQVLTAPVRSSGRCSGQATPSKARLPWQRLHGRAQAAPAHVPPSPYRLKRICTPG